MSKGRGDSPYRFTWLQCTRTTDNTTGDRPKSWTDNGKLWGGLDLTSSSEDTEYGATRSGASGQVYIRNYPAVTTADRLIVDGETYAIDGVRSGDNEMICEVHRMSGEAV